MACSLGSRAATTRQERTPDHADLSGQGSHVLGSSKAGALLIVLRPSDAQALARSGSSRPSTNAQTVARPQKEAPTPRAGSLSRRTSQAVTRSKRAAALGGLLNRPDGAQVGRLERRAAPSRCCLRRRCGSGGATAAHRSSRRRPQHHAAAPAQRHAPPRVGAALMLPQGLRARCWSLAALSDWTRRSALVRDGRLLHPPRFRKSVGVYPQACALERTQKRADPPPRLLLWPGEAEERAPKIGDGHADRSYATRVLPRPATSSVDRSRVLLLCPWGHEPKERAFIGREHASDARLARGCLHAIPTLLHGTHVPAATSGECDSGAPRRGRGRGPGPADHGPPPSAQCF